MHVSSANSLRARNVAAILDGEMKVVSPKTRAHWGLESFQDIDNEIQQNSWGERQFLPWQFILKKLRKVGNFLKDLLYTLWRYICSCSFKKPDYDDGPLL